MFLVYEITAFMYTIADTFACGYRSVQIQNANAGLTMQVIRMHNVPSSNLKDIFVK